MASKDLRVEAEPTMKNEEKSLMGGENCGHRTPSSIRVWGYQEKKINPAISSPVRSEALLIPSTQRLVWAAKQPLGNAALGALFA